ncbi:MAG TPA: hypothetical protein DCE41_01060 [Cytophagales bacterium]|nr:hypothetical protein [Cytophagales bacterium]HAA24071.1 hypothetical protein [Cytophagales bacterium]HAP62544.1 hypothetical protein [Cytophagales bacterium]
MKILLYTGAAFLGLALVSNPVKAQAIQYTQATTNQANGITLGSIFADDNFTYNNLMFNHYGIGSFNYDDGTAGNIGGQNWYASGYFGISLFTAGTERLRITESGEFGFGVTPSASDNIRNYFTGKTHFNGAIGIGMNNPQSDAMLAVRGGFMDLKDDAGVANNSELGTGIRIANHANNNAAAIVGYRGANANQTGLQFNTNNNGTTQRTLTMLDGIVYVGDIQNYLAQGVTNTEGYTLQVEGKIRTETVRVYDISQWRDFVFAPEFQLRPLSEVQSFIELNGHLPEVPSEAEVLAEGYEMVEMDATLLQKIEELTLYMIEQNHQLQEQQETIANLQAELETLRAESK